MGSETAAARRVHANAGKEFDAETQEAYERLDDLLDTYNAAQAAYAADRTDENRAAYKDAKAEFAAARTEIRLAEEADPEHPRGTNTPDSVTPETVAASISVEDKGN